MDSTQYRERYDRHIRLKGVGLTGQQKLSKAKVLVVGAGGLGSPVLLYITAAGIGHIGIVDDDIVSLSNLQRQVLYTMNDIGKKKVFCAKQRLEALNDQIDIQTYDLQLTNNNALDIIDKYDFILDCTDNFATRYMINDACVILLKPLIYGAIHSFEGQVSVFNWQKGANYRCLFPNPPQSNSVPSCNELGVIGTLPGIVGTYQANELIKCILNLGDILSNKLLTINTLTHQNQIFNFKKLIPIDGIPYDKATFLAMDYNFHCGIVLEEEPEEEDKSTESMEISFHKIKAQLDEEDVVWVDVRESHERPLFKASHVVSIPLSQFQNKYHNIPEKRYIYVFCHSGVRSLNAVKLLRKQFESSTILSVKGGILRMI